MQNATMVDNLFRNKAISLDRGALFDSNIPPKPSSFDFDRVDGMLLGIAIGDALGFPSESMLPRDRMLVYGEIRDYKNRGFPSDDTQLTFWTLEQLIQDRGFVPENVSRRFSQRGRIFGISSTVHRFLKNLQAGKPWHQSGPESAGNGALMRIAPILIPHLRSGGTNIWVDTALASMMTHNDRAAISSCLAFVAMLWELLDMPSAPDKQWWIERYVELARDLEGETTYTPSGTRFRDYSGPLWRFIEKKLPWADSDEMSVMDACNSWHSGADLLATVPCALFILMRHAHDPEEAIVRAVNDTKDNDTIAAIVGAAVGALHGRRGMPDRWIEKLSGRTTDRDDGHLFELIDNTKNTFWQNGTAQP
jgi:ADP-ribosyl-[dinitrogen reductase] hydrolase